MYDNKNNFQMNYFSHLEIMRVIFIFNETSKNQMDGRTTRQIIFSEPQI